jgi:hypothetical protein
LAAGPLTAAGNSFMDLPFSPRAAFIWDHTRQAIAWMNAAARAKFGLSLEGLSGALPKSLTRRFSQHLKKAEAGEAAYCSVKLKIAPHPVFYCCLEVLELASGHHGLVVAEAGAQSCLPLEPRPQSAQPKRALIKVPRARRTGAAAPGKLKDQETAVRQLTPEELRSFKAIGRSVRKLCREKRTAAAPPLPIAAPLRTKEQKRPASRARGTLCVPFSAFDVVLFLDNKLDIARTEGRPQCLGWRKSALLGRPTAQLLPAEERAILYSMVKKLGSAATQICRETIIVADGAGGGKPCHAVLGRCGDANAHYFLALLALTLPRRLKKLQLQPVRTASITRIAA